MNACIPISEIDSLRHSVNEWRLAGERIALVPTMGNLHEGHLSLVGEAARIASKVIVSIFINPLQFDRDDDLAAYPRTPQEDLDKLGGLGVDMVFTPGTQQVYPRGIEHTTFVEAPFLSQQLCGADRPGHFRGVATVVTKLFNMVQPDVAVFGEKDFQQLLIIRTLCEDLNLAIEIRGVPTVREADGLAMSSRNAYLTPDERKQAPILFELLQGLVARFCCGERRYGQLAKEANHRLGGEGFRPDYIELRRQSDLRWPDKSDSKLVLLAAAWLGRARLIDNILFDLNDCT